MSPTVPARARTVVVGGGVLGTSIAYHLAAAGERDVLLLEQTAISGGSTWHAAGMVGRMRPNGTLAKLNDLSIRLYRGLATATGVETEWRECGTLYVARVADRMVQYRRQRALVAQFGIDVELVGPAEAADLFPLQRREDLVGGIYVPGDGKVEPAMLGRALAAGATQAGATVIEGVRITGLVRHGHRVVGVETGDGDTIEAEHVVLANGMWARDLALTASVDVPLAPVQHHYAVSNPVSGFTAEEMDTWPCTRDTDGAIYYRTEGSQIWLGAFQEYTKPWLVDPVPHPFSFELLEPDWEHFASPQREGEHRLPILKQVGYERFVNGPESFTPDGNFLLGPSTAPGLWIAAGMNSAGIAFAGGAGYALASWIQEGVPPLDLSALDPARFSPAENGLTFLRARVTEALGTHYTMAWPGRELETARPLRVSPLHERTTAAGACFGQKAGIERPNWFGTETIPPVQTYGWGREPWFDAVCGEHLACREQAAIFDQSGFGKIEVAGADAMTVLNRLCANDVDVAPGHVVYTALLDDRGGFISDLTAIRLGEDRYRLITGTSQRVRDLATVTNGVNEGESCAAVDVTAAYAVIGLMGPSSRAILAAVTDANLSNDAFPFGTARQISIGDQRCLAVRITYVGELGWELHVSADQAGLVYDTLAATGAAHGLRAAGHYAINALRLEKAYRAWGHELAPDVTPIEAGLGFAVAWDKVGGFRGRDALLRRREAGVPPHRLVGLAVEDPDVIIWGGERIYLDGAGVGYTSSASYGHAVGRAIALGYVNAGQPVTTDLVAEGRFELEVAGDRVPVRATLSPFYDPKRERVLA